MFYRFDWCILQFDLLLAMFFLLFLVGGFLIGCCWMNFVWARDIKLLSIYPKVWDLLRLPQISCWFDHLYGCLRWNRQFIVDSTSMIVNSTIYIVKKKFILLFRLYSEFHYFYDNFHCHFDNISSRFNNYYSKFHKNFIINSTIFTVDCN